MTEAPAKIWATKSMAGQLNCPHKNVMGELATEYTRSDIAEELQAEVARLRESLGEFARFASKDGLGASVPFGQSKLHKARAALEYKD